MLFSLKVGPDFESLFLWAESLGALRCSRAVIPFMKTAGWGRIINISGGNARNAGNLSGGARNAGLVHMTKTLAVQFRPPWDHSNCIHPGTTRTERTRSLLAARATHVQRRSTPDESWFEEFALDSSAGGKWIRTSGSACMQERPRAIAGFGWKPSSLDYRRLLSMDITEGA
jgi:NAD(P)-dependent dehydrogenase (short-subunit alcohol dehydrogenase family)